MTTSLMDEIVAMRDVQLHPPADIPAFAAFEKKCGLALPGEHLDILRRTNGAEVYGGYVRLFGVDKTPGIDALIWNMEDYWKFAWDRRCTGYWCFAETAWGDQYAYSIDGLQNGKDRQVYFLDALSMTPEIVASSFAEFWHNEFARAAREPYDSMMLKARAKLGDLRIDTHIVYVPPILLGGTGDISNVQRMNARTAMICNGDIAVQLDAGPPQGAVKALTSYEDDFHRSRIRLIWA